MNGKPMCWAWYQRAGDYRPWNRHVPGCTCGMSAHHPPEQHDTTCPVRQNHVRNELLAKLIPGEPER